MIKQSSLLNTHFKKTSLNLDDGERLIREIQEMHDDLATYQDRVDSLETQSSEIVPLKARRELVQHPTYVSSLCAYKQLNVSRMGLFKIYVTNFAGH